MTENIENMDEAELAEVQEEFEFAVNEATIYFNDNTLFVVFGDGRNATLELSNDDERKIVKTVLSDVNFWAQFLDALSIAVSKHK